MSNSRLSIHLRVYRGKELTYNAQGKSTNENHIVKLEYNTAEYKRFLSMLKANGFIKADIEKVLDLSKVNTGKEKSDKDYYQEVSEFADIQKEVDLALNPNGEEKELTADQKTIANLTARLDALEGGKKEGKVELSDEEKVTLKVARDKYVELYGKKGHPGWSVDELNQKIVEFKPETK